MALPTGMGDGQGKCRRLSCSSKINAKLQTSAGQALDDGVFRRDIVEDRPKELAVPSRTKGKYETLVHRVGRMDDWKLAWPARELERICSFMLARPRPEILFFANRRLRAQINPEAGANPQTFLIWG